ncbi:pentatricopeptide repeat-containing protein At2g29760, chloroplastic isoform X2 [Elaeis guineensis]|uniref:Pentatricopeptide repeat-containing protein At1g08070, chloroplastic isoform X2 n=1 Tax=Elaeis guineensis var. tenera TaxID=51953 RepID=A0A8N4IAZ9_ELAGV|nr:pentatricopeptide repeat-containing protein At1g08070, chloroplastic isoform X2 [Elaeis guineensis]
MLKGHTEAGLHDQTLHLFNLMNRTDARPSRYTLPLVIKSCAGIPSLTEGEQAHCFAIKTGFEANVFVGPALIDMYSNRGVIESAYRVFSQMPVKNVVAWTAVVAAFLSAGDVKSARELFDQAVERDVILWNTMVCGYTRHGDMDAAQELFARMPDKDIICWNTMLLGYANCGDLEACLRFFEEMPERNVFSWNALIGGYARHGRYYEVLHVLTWMLGLSDVKPNDATLVMVLSACSRLGALNWGRWIHVYAEGNGFRGNVYVGNGLIDMYAKCGCIEGAVSVFDSMRTRDLVTWNSMIGGLAMHGYSMEALELFDRMKDMGEKPDGIALVGVLSACVHMGLVKEGFMHFRSMTEDYAIVPWIEHYGCMVNLLGRAGLLDEALDFVRKMPIEPDCVIWSALLGACQVHRNVGLAELTMNQLVRLAPEDAANYVVLSNIYGADGRSEDSAKLKLMMKERTMGKFPGCSLIEVDSEVVEFFSSDSRHLQTRKIYGLLEGLAKLSKSAGQG